MQSPPLIPSALSVLLGVLNFIAIIVIARWSRSWTTYPSRIAAFLSSAWSPAVAGIVTVLFVRIVWGSFHEPGVAHDERAYLLQAEIFASGHLTAPSPPFAAFFEQLYVFIEPAVFAKYPPAHALTLVPGIWLGLPGLMPALMTGLAGVLVFWLARRLANEWTALLTWWLWTTAWANLYWSASYFSETTSTAMWLVAVWATIRWLDSGRSAHLLAVAATLGWGLTTRPLTMAALALPLAFVILRRVMATRAWQTLAAPVALGAVILALGLLWNQQTLGDWRLDPWSQYARMYFPFDKPGFGVDPAPPLRPLVPEMVAVGELLRDLHAEHVLSSLPAAFAMRLIGIRRWCADGWRLAIGVLILSAVLHASGVERAGVVTIALFLIAYLTFAHPPMWFLYYVEVLPICYFLAARELGRVLVQGQRPGNQRLVAGAGGQRLTGGCARAAAARRERRHSRPRGDRSSQRLPPHRRSRDGEAAAGEGHRLRRLSSVPESASGSPPQRARPRVGAAVDRVRSRTSERRTSRPRT